MPTKLLPDPLSPTPARGSFWLHHKSGYLYEVIRLAREESTLRVVVVYVLHATPGKTYWIKRPEYSEEVWTRPIEEFLDGRFSQHP